MESGGRPTSNILLRRIEAGTALAPPVSGILHYPTGAGKTRVGMELIARALKETPRHLFIWATHTKNLLRQTMVRMAELSRLFPKGARFAWADAEEVKEGDADYHVIFMTRSALTDTRPCARRHHRLARRRWVHRLQRSHRRRRPRSLRMRADRSHARGRRLVLARGTIGADLDH